MNLIIFALLAFNVNNVYAQEFSKDNKALADENIPLEFIDNIKSCTVYEFEYTHPFTKEKVKKTINGIEGDKCAFVETMPGGLKLNCKFPLEKLPYISDEYSKTREEMLSSGTMSIRNESVLQEMANDSNVCVIEGLGI